MIFRIFILAAALAAAPPALEAAAPPAERFAPVADLAGWCFLGQLPDGARDLHCWEWVLQDKFLRDRHDVQGKDGVYSGETLYGWDEEAGVLRFWYFNSLGGVSEGQVEKSVLDEGVEAEWLFYESYRGNSSDSAVTGDPAATGEPAPTRLELRTRFTRQDALSYTVASERRDGDQWRSDWTMRLDRVGSREISRGGEWTESWDLVFNTDRDGNYEVYQIDSRSGALSNLTAAPGTEWVYVGGEKLLLVSNRPSGVDPGYRLYELDLAQQKPELFQLTDFPTPDSWAGVLPDRKGFIVCAVVDGDRDLVEIDRWGVVQRVLTDHEGEDCQPDVSSDGQIVVFWSDRGGSAEIWRMNIDGSGARQLTEFSGNDRAPPHRYGGEGPARISPDGKQIAWMSLRNRETFDIFVMSIDGTEIRRLTDHLADDGYPSWSPDGQYIAFDSNRFGSHDIFVMTADGSGLQRITDHESPELAPAFVPRARYGPSGSR